MFDYTHAIVIDAQGYKVDFVLVEDKIRPLHYKLQKGELLVFDDVSTANSMIAPRWDAKKSEWQETGTPPPLTPEEIKQLRAAKLAEVGAACTAVIHAGVTVETGEGEKHFSLEPHDQTELMGLKPHLDALLAAGDVSTPAIPYHADGELCRLWTAADFGVILQAAMRYIFYHRTYCNHLNIWIRREDADKLPEITYDVDLPDDLRQNMQVLLTAAGGGDAGG